MAPNNAINPDNKKRRAFVAPLIYCRLWQTLTFYKHQFKLKKPFLRMVRGLLAVCLLATGAYWFATSAQGWYQADFKILTSGEKGKGVFSGLLFSASFMAYGAWEIYRLVKENKARRLG